MTWGGVSGAAWLTWLAYWVIAARSTGATARQVEGWPSRVLHFGLVIPGFVLLFGPTLIGGDACGWRSLPVLVSGFMVQVAGLLLTVSARHHLGRNWSGALLLRTGHRIVRSGPYAAIRHPIYAGLLIAIAGSAAVAGRCQGLLAIPLGAAAFLRKAWMEDRLLAGAFGPEHEEYRRNTGALFPTRAARASWRRGRRAASQE